MNLADHSSVLRTRTSRAAVLSLGLLLAVGALVGCAEAATDPAADPPAADPAPAPTPDPAGAFEAATVTWVIDGDTIEVRFGDGSLERVRLIGVDAPETDEGDPYGPQAAAFTARALQGRSVFLEYDVRARDRYERMLAYVWVEKPSAVTDAEIRAKMFNARLLLDGYAQLLTIPPNVAHADRFTVYQTEAREAGRGLWGVAPAAPGAGAAGTVDWSQARAHVGQRVTVVGRVMGTHFAARSNRQPTFINIGRDYPDPERFTVVIWGDDRAQFPSAPEDMYEGRMVRVTGTVSLFRNSPQIEVSDPNAIEVE